jgi:choline dehydrogenase-like flavoprotein
MASRAMLIPIRASLGRVCGRLSDHDPAMPKISVHAAATPSAELAAAPQRSTACAPIAVFQAIMMAGPPSAPTGWGWNDVLSFFRKLENDTDFDGALHGKDGPITMRRWPREQWPPFTNALMKAIEDAGWHDIEDQNGTGTDGHFPLVVNDTLDGQRISAARGYLTRDVRARGNLTILGNTTATRLIFDGRRVTGIAGLRDGQPFEAFPPPGRTTPRTTRGVEHPHISLRWRRRGCSR